MDESSGPARLAPITRSARAEHLLDPFRAGLLAGAREPVSATDLAERLGETRQRVNYHVHALAQAGLLEPAGQRGEGIFAEDLYRASARAYLIVPSVLGELAPAPRQGQDPGEVDELLALTARTQSEVATAMADAQAGGEADGRSELEGTLAIDATVPLATPAQRAAFRQALETAVREVVQAHTRDLAAIERAPTGTGRYRVVVTGYPLPEDAGAGPEGDR